MTPSESALAWRKRMKLSRVALSKVLGYSTSTIQEYEEGRRRGKPENVATISPAHWRRYALALAAIEAGLDPFA